MSRFKLFISALFLLSFTACGGGLNPDLQTQDNNNEQTKPTPEPPKDIQQLSGQNVEVLNDLNLSFSEQTVEGSGLLKFIEGFKQPEMGFNFNLDFEMGKDSQLRLISFADQDLKNGIELIFSYDSNKLVIKFKSNDSYENITPFFRSRITPSSPSLSIDIHNDHGTLPHIVIWDLKTQRLVFDSSLFGKGYGTYWGLELNNAKVNRIHKASPRDDH